MRKFLILVGGLFVSACVQQESVLEQPTPIVVNPELEMQPIIPVPNEPQPQQEVRKTQVNTKVEPLFSHQKTYMAELSAQLNKTVGDSGLIVKHQGAQIVVVMPDSIIFGTNQMTLEPQAESILAEIARTLKEYDRVKIQIFGYTDDEGTVAENKTSSLRQANTVSNFLRLNGVDINRIIVDGMGPENPIATNKTATGREQNRRVEITLINML